MSNGAESNGIVLSMGIIILGNILKLVNNDVGNLVQGLGFGSGIGTTAHVIDQMYPNTMTPHHDVIGIISLPFIYATDKTNLIKNKSITNNLYGGAIGLTMQHLLTEGCSFCGNTYCPPGTNLC